MLTQEEIVKRLAALNEELKFRGVCGELYLAGGAVMCLALKSRVSTKDVDALFEPKEAIREAAKVVAERMGADDNWLNDAVKGFLSPEATFDEYAEMSNLRIFTATPSYILAMKCMSMRIGISEDIADIKHLICHLHLKSVNEVFDVVQKYYPAEQIPQRTYFALQELFNDPPNVAPSR